MSRDLSNIPGSVNRAYLRKLAAERRDDVGPRGLIPERPGVVALAGADELSRGREGRRKPSRWLRCR
jgi:hypothetical protein